MMMFKAGRFVSRVFYAELDALGPDTGNLLAFVYRDPGEDVWRLDIRFRYYVDRDLTSKSKDRKSRYEGSSPPGATLAQFMPTLKLIFEMAGAGSFEEVIIESDDPAVVIARLKEQEWAHVQEHTRKPGDS